MSRKKHQQNYFPSLKPDVEQYYFNQGYNAVIGVDEVGRGSLAGPVMAAAVALFENSRIVTGVNDSKLLTACARYHLYQQLSTSGIIWAYGLTDASIIDLIGIEKATGEAMHTAVINLKMAAPVLIDGPRVPGRIEGTDDWHPFTKGDARVYCIAAASIMAKVRRDALMTQLDATFSHYCWERNKGYGTKAHFTAIQQFGLCNQHRQTFVHI